MSDIFKRADDTSSISKAHWRTGLTGGSNTFTVEARVSSGTGTVARPYIIVISV